MTNSHFATFKLLLIYITCAKTSDKKLLLISLDGFRYDYLRKYNTPNLNNFAKNGVSTPEGIIPVFPTDTAPNHHTLVTGLFSESHGVIGNEMYDPELKKTIKYVIAPSQLVNAAEPIWITAGRSGLKTGVLSWPGSHFKYDGMTADFYQLYKSKRDFTERVDTVIEWLVEKNVNFVALYFMEPDYKAHYFGGPDSSHVAEEVEKVDGVIGYLLGRLKKEEILDRVNIIVTSDHGMSPIVETESNTLVLNKHLDRNDYDLILQTGATGTVLPKKGKEEKVFLALNNKHAHVKVYRKKDIPERLHYRDNRLVLPVVAVAEEGYLVCRTGCMTKDAMFGNHGYDNNVVNMRGVFLASGPAFRRNVQLPAFDNVHVYSLMCHLLNITARPSNGSLSIFLPVLSNGSNGLEVVKRAYSFEVLKDNVVKQASSIVLTTATVSLIYWWKS